MHLYVEVVHNCILLLSNTVCTPILNCPECQASYCVKKAIEAVATISFPWIRKVFLQCGYSIPWQPLRWCRIEEFCEAQRGAQNLVEKNSLSCPAPSPHESSTALQPPKTWSISSPLPPPMSPLLSLPPTFHWHWPKVGLSWANSCAGFALSPRNVLYGMFAIMHARSKLACIAQDWAPRLQSYILLAKSKSIP